ncbi:MAG: hypothetical protein JWN18_499 [Parcubacteria group bacterium]|nr:hypothetical protein [Parcubacteria group bacterium]
MEPIDLLIQDAKHIRLGEGVKSRMRNDLLLYAQQHPATSIPSPYERFIHVLSPFTTNSRLSFAALALLLVIAVGGGTTLASMGSLPGDSLYSLKVSVLEPARGLLALSSEAQADWHVSVTETRLKEIEDLASKEKLSPEVGKESQARFDTSLDSTQNTLEKLALNNPEAAAKTNASFSVALSEHQVVLDTLSTDATSTGRKEVIAFADHVRSRLGERLGGASAAKVRSATPVGPGDEKQNGEDTGDPIMMMSVTAVSSTTATSTGIEATTTASTTITVEATTTQSHNGVKENNEEEGFIIKVKHRLGF